MPKQIPKAWVLIMLNKKNEEKYLIINNYGVVYNRKTKTMTAGNRVKNNKLVIDYIVTEVEEDDVEIAFILCHLQHPSHKRIITTYGKLVNEYSMTKC